jgi:hypothetical protein
VQREGHAERSFVDQPRRLQRIATRFEELVLGAGPTPAENALARGALSRRRAGDNAADRVDVMVSAVADLQLGDEALWRTLLRATLERWSAQGPDTERVPIRGDTRITTTTQALAPLADAIPPAHPGVAVTASSGDGGFGVEFPAVSPFVTGVGGTSLVRDDSARGWSETAWSGAGSGCSTVEGKPSWQTDGGCGNRTVADVSAVADPNTGVAVFDSNNGG